MPSRFDTPMDTALESLDLDDVLARQTGSYLVGLQRRGKLAPRQVAAARTLLECRGDSDVMARAREVVGALWPVVRQIVLESEKAERLACRRGTVTAVVAAELATALDELANAYDEGLL